MQLTMRILFAPMLLLALAAQTPPVERYPVNILSFSGGSNGVCDPTGSMDSTACIQAAIDYAASHHVSGIACPGGQYKTSQPLYIDPPGNLRGSAAAWSSTKTYAQGDVVAYDITKHNDAIPWVSLSSGNHGNAPSTLSAYWRPTAAADPTNFSFSLSFFGLDTGMGSHEGGCEIRPSFNNAVAVYLGPGQRMSVKDLAIIGPGGTYAGLQDQHGIALAITGGRGGSSNNLVDGVDAENFYTAFKTDANGGCCLSDSNSFRKIMATNAEVGIDIEGSQSYINDVQEPMIQAVVGIRSAVGKAVTVEGGNISTTSLHSGSFAMSNLSGLIDAGVIDGRNTHNFGFTARIASPDDYFCKVYNAYTIHTANFGVVPLTCTAWNATTHIATFAFTPSWVMADYGSSYPLNTATDMESEIQAATIIYATEEATTFAGVGFDATGVHVENNGCTQLINTFADINGAQTNRLSSMYFNFDPGWSNYAPANGPSGAQLAVFYCAETFPFIWQQKWYQTDIFGGHFGMNSSPQQPILIDLQANGISANETHFHGVQYLLPNTRVSHNEVPGFYNYIAPYASLENEVSGGGVWETTPFGAFTHSGSAYDGIGYMGGPFCGFHHCPWTTPNIPPGLFLQICPGATGTPITCRAGTLGSAPAVDAQTIYSSIEYNSGALNFTRLRTTGLGYSWGQNITDGNAGGRVTWSYKGQTNIVSLDANTLKWMLPGLSIGIPDVTGGTDWYVVTGVYPGLGYVTIWNPLGQLTAGNKAQVYSCSTGCTIEQQPYSWTRYP